MCSICITRKTLFELMLQSLHKRAHDDDLCFISITAVHSSRSASPHFNQTSTEALDCSFKSKVFSSCAVVSLLGNLILR